MYTYTCTCWYTFKIRYRGGTLRDFRVRFRKVYFANEINEYMLTDTGRFTDFANRPVTCCGYCSFLTRKNEKFSDMEIIEKQILGNGNSLYLHSFHHDIFLINRLP